jgi:hypothetical protein
VGTAAVALPGAAPGLTGGPRKILQAARARRAYIRDMGSEIGRWTAIALLGVSTMNTTKTAETLELQAALAAPGRSPEIPEESDLYGWLIGSWELDVVHYWVDVAGRGLKGEAHFGWVLEGRAVQDVWIMPRRAERKGPLDKALNCYGTTLRVWDADLKAWRVTWVNPVTGQRDQLIGRWSGKDVVQLGTSADGTPIRWRFVEITADSFRWIGEALEPDGKTWKLGGEFRARRMR